MSLAIAKFLRRRTLWFLAVKVILSFMVFAYAANVTITTTVYRAENGGLINVIGNLIALDRGVSKTTSAVAAAGTSCGSNVTFTGSLGTANAALALNHFVYSIQVNTTSNTPANTCFTVTLTITPNGGSLTSYTVYIASGASVTPDQTINCEFDIGSILPASPYSFSVAVQ
jgi:hypothetical protein